MSNKYLDEKGVDTLWKAVKTEISTASLQGIGKAYYIELQQNPDNPELLDYIGNYTVAEILSFLNEMNEGKAVVYLSVVDLGNMLISHTYSLGDYRIISVTVGEYKIVGIINGEQMTFMHQKFEFYIAPTAPTPDVDTNNDTVATTAFVNNKIANLPTTPTKISELENDSNFANQSYVDTKVADLVDSAPEALNTLGELATALNNHEDAYDALLETVGKKANSEDLATVAKSGEYGDLNNTPTSLPANGGNSSTVNNYTVNSDVPANAKFTDTTYEAATTATDGLMSKEDKTKLDNLESSSPVEVVDNLESASITAALSANMGKKLASMAPVKMPVYTVLLGSLDGEISIENAEEYLGTLERNMQYLEEGRAFYDSSITISAPVSITIVPYSETTILETIIVNSSNFDSDINTGYISILGFGLLYSITDNGYELQDCYLIMNEIGLPVDTYWSDIHSTPTSLSGYGIKDAYTKTEVDSKIGDISTILDSLNGEVI